MADFSIEPTVDGAETVVRLIGELDVASAYDVRALISTALDRPGLTTLSLDLSDLNFIDSTGLGALTALREAAREKGVDVRVQGTAAARVQRVFDITGVGQLFGLPPHPDHG